MASIIIDGYNLTGIQYRNIEAARNELVERLGRYAERKGHDVTVVFDGWQSGGSTVGEEVSGGVRILYSALGQKADALIGKILSTDKRHWIVISSDREVQAHAWANGSVPIDADIFTGILERGPGAEGVPPDEDDEYEALYGSPTKKGRPRTPSKKQKAIVRALKKL